MTDFLRSWNTTLIHGQTADLGPKVEEVDRKVHELSDNLEVKLQALTVLASTQGNDEEAAALSRLKDTVRSAATVLSAASTIVDASEIRAGNVRSNSSVSPWEPDENFHQWMATVVDHTAVSPDNAGSRPGSGPQYLDTDTSTAMSVIRSQNSGLRIKRKPVRMTGGLTEVPATTEISVPDVQDEDTISVAHSVSMEQELVSSPLPSHDEDLSPAVTTPPDKNQRSDLTLELPGHTRSSSGSSIVLGPASPTSPKIGKSSFWKRSLTGSRLNSAEWQSGLKVHEPKSSASFQPQRSHQGTRMSSDSRSYMHKPNIP